MVARQQVERGCGCKLVMGWRRRSGLGAQLRDLLCEGFVDVGRWQSEIVRVLVVGRLGWRSIGVEWVLDMKTRGGRKVVQVRRKLHGKPVEFEVEVKVRDVEVAVRET